MPDMNEDASKMDGLLDPIRPSEGAVLRNEMSYVYGRDPSILAYSQRPGPSAMCKKNLSSDYEIEESICPEGLSLGSVSLSSATVKVYLRLKPLPRKIKLSGEQEAAYDITNSTTLLTKIPSLDSTTISLKKGPYETVCRRFTFTETFGPETTQLTLFERVIQPQMLEFFEGQNCIAMTYGTTNSGKSYTLQGSTSSPGIIPRSLEYVFSNINPKSSPCYKPIHNCDIISLSPSERSNEIDTKTKILSSIISEKHQYINAYRQMQQLLEEESPQRPSQAPDAQYLVWVSFAEIYNETIYDLLSNESQRRRTPLKLATDNQGRAFIKGLKTVCVNSGSEAYQVLMAGQCNLKVAATALNARSSRSHCIFTITLLKFYAENRPDLVEISRFSFCDLAGSERLKKTLNVGDRLKEAQNINTSLLVLGRCLKSIYEGQIMKQRQDHVGPFRESKLTRLFQQALSGKEPMALIVNVNPLPNLYEETQNVLNFAAIAKKIIIEPKKPKRKRSKTRFSLVVAQSAKTTTDWDDTELEIIAEQSLSEADETQSSASSLPPEDYDEIISENDRLKREMAALKASNLKRDLQTRQEMALFHSEMMDKLEQDYKNKMQDLENQQEDLLDWQLSRLRTYYENKLASKKRKYSDADDESGEDDEEANVQDLRAENSRLSSDITQLKATIKDLRKQKDNIDSEKNTLKYESSLLKDELKSVKALLASMEQDLTSPGDSAAYEVELKMQLTAARDKIKSLKNMLNEAKEEYIAITDDCRAKEEAIAQFEAEEIIQKERYDDLEKELDEANALFAEETKSREQIENQLEREIKLRVELQKQLEILKQSVIPGVIKQEHDNLIKQEMLSGSRGNSILENPEVYLGSQDIPFANDQASVINNLKTEIEQLEEEKSSLNDKLIYSLEQVESLKGELELAKERLDEITLQLGQMSAAKLSSARSENYAEEIVDNCDTESIDKIVKREVCTVDQDNQTSFIDPVNEHKALQTTLNGSEELEVAHKELDDMKTRYDELKSNFDNQVSRIRELDDELSGVKEHLKTLQNGIDDKADESEKFMKENAQLQLRLTEISEERHKLSEQVDEFEGVKEDFEAQIKGYRENLVLLEREISAFQKSEKTNAEETSKLVQELAVYKEKLQNLEHCDLSSKQILEERFERIQELEQKLESMSDLEKEIANVNHSLTKCQSDKTELEINLKTNEEKISNLTLRLEQSKITEKESHEEIVKLQKEVKEHITKVSEDATNLETEKEHKKIIQELTDTRLAVNETKKLNEELEAKVKNLLESRSDNYEQTQRIIVTLQQNVEEQKLEIKELKATNASLIKSLDEKEIEMENFSRNRNDMIEKYENLVKNTQQELDREKREVMRYQELFSRQALTPREKDDNSAKFRAPSDDRATFRQKENKPREDYTSDDVSPKCPSSRRPRRAKQVPLVSENSQSENVIQVVELSDSETKRTTRRTAAVGNIPSSEKKPRGRKKLFSHNTSIVDIPDEVPASPMSTRSMRTRRK